MHPILMTAASNAAMLFFMATLLAVLKLNISDHDMRIKTDHCFKIAGYALSIAAAMAMVSLAIQYTH